MILLLFSPLLQFYELRAPKRRRTLAGQKGPLPVQIRFPDRSSIEKTSPVRQANLPEARIAASSSRNAVSFSSIAGLCDLYF
jgi:hypothetical protein